MTDHSITPPPPHLLKKFSAQAQDEANKRNGTGYLKTFATFCIEWFVNSRSTSNDRQIRSSEIQPPTELVQQWINEGDGIFAEPLAASAALTLRVVADFIEHRMEQAAANGWKYEARGIVNDLRIAAFEQGHSLAVRAVLNAYRDASWAPDTKDPNKHHKWSHKAGLAAALRVVADEVLPSPRLPFDSCCEIRSAGERVELLAIATELEAQ